MALSSIHDIASYYGIVYEDHTQKQATSNTICFSSSSSSLKKQLCCGGGYGYGIFCGSSTKVENYST